MRRQLLAAFGAEVAGCNEELNAQVGDRQSSRLTPRIISSCGEAARRTASSADSRRHRRHPLALQSVLGPESGPKLLVLEPDHD